MHRYLSVIKQILFQVIRNVMADKLRTLMTMLGMIIGTGAFISMMTIMDIRLERLVAETEKKGAANLEITINEWGSLENGIRPTQLKWIERIEHVKLVVPTLQGDEPVNVKSGSVVLKKVNINATISEYFDNVKNIELLSGRYFNSDEEKQKANVCIINGAVADKLYMGENPIGKNISIYGSRFEVIGTFSKYQEQSEEKLIYIPLSSFRKLTGQGINSFTVFPESYIYSAEIKEKLDRFLESVVHTQPNDGYYDSYDSYEYDVEMDTITKASNVQTAIAAIALIIGGIGIMNMMLVMVTERTVEIGLRKALGATPKRIQFQFVLEAVILSIGGGLIGVIVGVIGSIAYCISEGHALHINPVSIIVGLAFSAIVGTFFGWSPARAASRLNPIDALKSE